MDMATAWVWCGIIACANATSAASCRAEIGVGLCATDATVAGGATDAVVDVGESEQPAARAVVARTARTPLTRRVRIRTRAPWARAPAPTRVGGGRRRRTGRGAACP